MLSTSTQTKASPAGFASSAVPMQRFTNQQPIQTLQLALLARALFAPTDRTQPHALQSQTPSACSAPSHCSAPAVDTKSHSVWQTAPQRTTVASAVGQPHHSPSTQSHARGSASHTTPTRLSIKSTSASSLLRQVNNWP